MATMLRLGVDTGGTFTDLVLLDDKGGLRVHKVLSTPDAPERAILRGIAELGIDLASLSLVHGSTVATNAVLEGKGVKTLYITNRGFADLLTIGRQRRADLYALQPSPSPPPVPPEWCLETGGRVDAEGRTIEPLSDDALTALVAAVAREAPAAVAVNLLFSYLDPEAERRIEAALPSDLFVSLSSRVLPEVGEYERGMATWLNAWVGPKVAGYLGRLTRGLGGERGGVPVAVMQSCGDTVAAAQAAEHAVRMLLSGPAGGLVGARHVGAAAGATRVLSFDMGGTSTDVALIDGEPRLTTEGRIGRYPVAVPMVDMHTIGAGGGSIAWLDDGGMLQVGPQSAGAAPGPACYGRGGRLPTVTDANLLLGRLPADAFLGGEMTLNVAAARAALAVLARRSGQRVEQLASDIVAVANEHMARALRAIAIKSGADPAEQLLLSFGGAGGLHVCALAALLGVREALVPRHAGVLSAFGMLVGRPGRQLSRSHIGLLEHQSPGELDALFDELACAGLRALAAEGQDPALCAASASADLRYRGQSYTLNVPWRGIDATREAFHAAHQARYGHRLAMPVELVNMRQAVRGPQAVLRLPRVAGAPAATPFGFCRVSGVADPVPKFWRDELVGGQRIDGPCLVCEKVATTWVAPSWRLQVDPWGNLRLEAVSDRPGCADWAT